MPSNFAPHFRTGLLTLALLSPLGLAAQSPAVQQGNAALAKGDLDLAVSLLEQAVAQFPGDAEAHHHLANAYGTKAEKGGMLAAARYAPKAKGAWERAVALNPNHADARMSLVDFYAMAPGIMGGSIEKAGEHAKALRAIDPLLGHRAQASIYLVQKKPDLAKKEYLEAVREQPHSAKAHLYLGKHFADVDKNFAGAFAEFEAALKADPAFMPAWYQLGRAVSLANTNHARGEQALKKYLTYTPKEKEPTLASAHYRLGLIQEQSGRRNDAKQSFSAALRLNPALKEASEALKRLS